MHTICLFIPFSIHLRILIHPCSGSLSNYYKEQSQERVEQFLRNLYSCDNIDVLRCCKLSGFKTFDFDIG